MQGKVKRAREVFVKYFGTRPEDGRLHFQPGQMFEAEKNYGAALEEFRAKVERGPDSAHAYSFLARNLNRFGQYAEAAENGKAAIERLPRNNGGYEELAVRDRFGRCFESGDAGALCCRLA